MGIARGHNNVLLRRLRLPADRVGQGLAALRTTVGEPIAFDQTRAKLAARLGEAHALTFYDACWAAAAPNLGVPLVSADRQLLDAGLAEVADGCGHPARAAEHLRGGSCGHR